MEGYQTFYIRGKPVTKKEAIKFIQEHSPIFTPASSEIDNVSKELITNGVDIWKGLVWEPLQIKDS